MPEEKYEVKTFETKYLCDECGDGYLMMDDGGYIAGTDPPQYSHSCDNCPHTQNFTSKNYPAATQEKTLVLVP